MTTKTKKAIEKKLTQVITAKPKVKTRDDEPTLFEQVANLADIDEVNTKIGDLDFDGAYLIAESTDISSALRELASGTDSISGELATTNDKIGTADWPVEDMGEHLIERTDANGEYPINIVGALRILDGAITEVDSNVISLDDTIGQMGTDITDIQSNLQTIGAYVGEPNTERTGVHVSSNDSIWSALESFDDIIGDESQMPTGTFVFGGVTIMENLTALDGGIAQVATDSTVTVTQAQTATNGYAATYTIAQGGTTVGTINIPKDFLVKSVSLETVATADTPVTGYVVGQKYIDFVINTVDSSENAQHIYLLVNDLVDVYTAQANAAQVQIAINSSNVISATIVAGSITATELASDAVTTTKILDANVTTAKIADGNVTTAKLDASAVTTAKIADSNVTTAKIADSNVTTSKLADDAVTAAKIANGAVGTAAIAIEDEDIVGDIYTVAIKTGRLIVRKIASATPGE